MSRNETDDASTECSQCKTANPDRFVLYYTTLVNFYNDYIVRYQWYSS